MQIRLLASALLLASSFYLVQAEADPGLTLCKEVQREEIPPKWAATDLPALPNTRTVLFCSQCDGKPGHKPDEAAFSVEEAGDHFTLRSKSPRDAYFAVHSLRFTKNYYMAPHTFCRVDYSHVEKVEVITDHAI
ncbi:hypothetical protein CBS101457_005084 [Exobasidium rhododendri]|nr:hypothetical protein CBS101457_005084 [Exobasidium rhododendri]